MFLALTHFITPLFHVRWCDLFFQSKLLTSGESVITKLCFVIGWLLNWDYSQETTNQNSHERNHEVTKEI
jgi:hypothetical protein